MAITDLPVPGPPFIIRTVPLSRDLFLEIKKLEIFLDLLQYKLLVPFVEKLFRSRMIKPRDIIVCDKGFTSKQNYRVLINRFYVIPIIYPKINTNLDKVIDSFNPPLDIFFSEKNKMKLWLKIVSDFKKLIVKWGEF